MPDLNAFKHIQSGVTYSIAMGKTGEFEVKDTVHDAVSFKSMRSNWQVQKVQESKD